MLTKRRLESRVPHILGLPICRSDGRTDKVVSYRINRRSCEGVDHGLKLVEIVLRSVGGWTMSVSGVEIRFVSYLETENIATKDPLALRGDICNRKFDVSLSGMPMCDRVNGAE
jgi:hypothetical protein